MIVTDYVATALSHISLHLFVASLIAAKVFGETHTRCVWLLSALLSFKVWQLPIVARMVTVHYTALLITCIFFSAQSNQKIGRIQ